MSRLASVAVCLASALAPLPATQGATPLDALRDCARDLTDLDHGDEAMWAILDGGPAAAAALLAEVRAALARGQPDWNLLYEQVRLLGVLGAEAAHTCQALVALFPVARPRVQDLLLWVFGEIGPSAPEPARTAAVKLVLAEGVDRRHVWVTIPKCELGSTASFEKLLEGLKSSNSGERLAATELLLEFVPQLRATPESVVAMRNEAIAAWGHRGERYRRAALAWERILIAVVPSHADVPYAHANLLQHQDPRVRLAAAQALVGLGSRAAPLVTPLAAATADSSPRVAKAAIMALGSLGLAASEARPALLRAAQRVELRSVAMAALTATERLAERQERSLSAGYVAVRAFASATPLARRGMVTSLARLGREVASDVADELMRDPFERDRNGLRRDLVAVLVAMGDDAIDGLPALVWWIDHEPEPPAGLLRAALAEVGRLGPLAARTQPDLAPTIRGWLRWGVDHRAQIADALAGALVHAGTETHSLVELLGHPSTTVRLHAARELGGRGEPGVALALVDAMRAEHPPFDTHYFCALVGDLGPKVRTAAAESLVSLRFRDVEVWRTAVADTPEEDVAKVAVVALTAMGRDARSAVATLRARRARASPALALLIDEALRAIE